MFIIKNNKKQSKEVIKTKKKIKEAKTKAKKHSPKVLNNVPNNNDIEVLKF